MGSALLAGLVTLLAWPSYTSFFLSGIM